MLAIMGKDLLFRVDQVYYRLVSLNTYFQQILTK
jgi:hypothetical protein